MDGPSHFLKPEGVVPTGVTAFRTETLKNCGYRVESVRHLDLDGQSKSTIRQLFTRILQSHPVMVRESLFQSRQFRVVDSSSESQSLADQQQSLSNLDVRLNQNESILNCEYPNQEDQSSSPNQQLQETSIKLPEEDDSIGGFRG